MQIAIPNGGSIGSLRTSDYFGILSNYTASPTVFTCPTGPRTAATSFPRFEDANLSYLIGTHATPTKALEILSADLDIEGGFSTECSVIGNVRVVEFPGSSGIPETFTAAWSGSNHVSVGNILLTDGTLVSGDRTVLRKTLAESPREGSSSIHTRSPR